MIITKIGFRSDQSHKIKCNVLIHFSVWESIHNVRRREITNNKIGSRLLSMAAKLRALRGCMAKEEAELALDMILKGAIRGQL